MILVVVYDYDKILVFNFKLLVKFFLLVNIFLKWW